MRRSPADVYYPLVSSCSILHARGLLRTMSAAAVRKERTPYQQPLERVVAELGTDLRNGLTQAEARRRLERYGRNELTAKKPVPAWRKFLAQFQDPLVILWSSPL
ncbi:MAG TPA: cation-transporting P-type ATPase [Pyrinomonadaceae bacterium]|nr:cation-transporting P-type ATPase [Pyrinomonadaceae bacterium]